MVRSGSPVARAHLYLLGGGQQLGDHVLVNAADLFIGVHRPRAPQERIVVEGYLEASPQRLPLGARPVGVLKRSLDGLW